MEPASQEPGQTILEKTVTECIQMVCLLLMIFKTKLTIKRRPYIYKTVAPKTKRKKHRGVQERGCHEAPPSTFPTSHSLVYSRLQSKYNYRTPTFSFHDFISWVTILLNSFIFSPNNLIGRSCNLSMASGNEAAAWSGLD